MDQIRIQCLKWLNVHSREHKVLKTLWRLSHKVHPVLNIPIICSASMNTQKNAIDRSISISTTFKTAYDTYLAIHDARIGGHYREINGLIITYQPNGTVLDTAMTTLHKDLHGIIIATKLSYSNGPIEGINHKIKELKLHAMASPTKPKCSSKPTR